MKCSKCGREVPQEAKFCPDCGNQITWFSVPKAPGEPNQAPEKPTVQQSSISTIPASAEKNQPQTNSTKEKTNKGIICAIIVGAVLIATAVLALNMKKCDNCGRLFLGEGHNFLGYTICDSCWD